MIRMSFSPRLSLFLLALTACAIGPAVMQPRVVSSNAPAFDSSFELPDLLTVPVKDARLRRAPFPGPIPAKLTRIIDGDTFEARIRIWFGQEITTLVRVRGFDAPELKSRCASEATGAHQASDLLGDLLDVAKIELRDVTLDKYGGRVVATVMVSDPAFAAEPLQDISGIMLATGLVRAYNGGTRQSWCNLTVEAH